MAIIEYTICRNSKYARKVKKKKSKRRKPKNKKKVFK